MPLTLRPTQVVGIRVLNDVPALRRVHGPDEMLLLEVPNGLSTAHAALTEPMAAAGTPSPRPI